MYGEWSSPLMPQDGYVLIVKYRTCAHEYIISHLFFSFFLFFFSFVLFALWIRVSQSSLGSSPSSPPRRFFLPWKAFFYRYFYVGPRVNRAYGTDQNPYTYLFLPTIIRSYLLWSPVIEGLSPFLPSSALTGALSNWFSVVVVVVVVFFWQFFFFANKLKKDREIQTPASTLFLLVTVLPFLLPPDNVYYGGP